MKEDFLSINNLIEWYKTNALISIPSDFFVYMISRGILTPFDTSLYSLSQANDFLLEKQGCEFVEIYGKYRVKDNRKAFIGSFKPLVSQSKKKYKIASLDGKNFKLIKL